MRDKSKEPDKFTQVLNALVPRERNDIGANVSTPEPLQFWKAELPISVIVDGKDATTLWQFWNAESPITARRLVEFRVTLRRFVRPANTDVPIVIRLSGRVTYWIVDGMKVENAVGIVVIVLVLLKMMVLKDGQAMVAAFRYEMLDTSRNSVVKFGRLLNTPAGASVVIEGDNVRNWIGLMKLLKVVGIVVIVLVFLKTMVLKDGQLMALAFKYEILDTSRNSVENLGRVLNTPLTLIVVMEGDNVRNWTFVITLLKLVGIVVIVLVFWKMMVLKDGQLMALAFRYEILATSRNSVVNLGRVLNTPLTLSVVMEGGIVMEDSLEPVNVPGRIVVSVLLRDKSKEPEILQLLNAFAPRESKRKGENTNPVPRVPQFWKAFILISVILEEKEATRRLQPLNAFGPIDVRFWVL